MDLRRSLPTLGLVALLVVDLALVVWALWPSSTPRSAAAPSSTSSFSGSASPTGSGSPSPSPSPSDGEGEAVPAAPLTRLVAGVDARVAWLADAGTCEDAGAVHVTTDGGQGFSTAAAPGSVTRVRPSDEGNGFVVGGDSRCRIRLWNTGVAGEEWTDAQSAADAWGRDPEDATRVHRPGGDPVTPCEGGARVVDLAGLRDGVGSVVCSDGTLRTTTNGGGRWTTTLTAEGLVALSLTAPGRGAIALVTGDCAGVAVAALDDGKAGEVQCIEDVTPREGQVAVSVVARATWLVAGDTVLRAGSANASTGEFEKVGTWPEG
ncbi:hypothetical protein ACK8HX_09935 [Oryzobacter sp. R7]|uniref:hypothetical protein n=1 Tax=Oryzobacter faecalis TaxID=3388656 RepID=UPI00398D4244